MYQVFLEIVEIVPYSPEKNGAQELINCIVLEKARALLIDSGLSKNFWDGAVPTAIYLKNRTPTIAVRGAIPKEL